MSYLKTSLLVLVIPSDADIFVLLYVPNIVSNVAGFCVSTARQSYAYSMLGMFFIWVSWFTEFTEACLPFQMNSDGPCEEKKEKGKQNIETYKIRRCGGHLQ